MTKRVDGPLPALHTQRHDDRGVRVDSVTNQLRALVKQKPGKQRRALVLEPLDQLSTAIQGLSSADQHNNGHGGGENVSLLKQIQGPVSLQWLVDDFVKAAAVGDLAKVDRYIRGGIPIDMKHSVLQCTALHASAALHDDAVTKHLVQAGANLDILTKTQESTLHLAARYGSTAVAQEALRNRAEMRLTNLNGMTAMEVAADVQNHSMEQLLEPPPDPPSDLRATAVSATSITVAWVTHCAATSAYQYRITWTLGGSMGELSEVCSFTSLRIAHLMPASRYQIRVQAGNHSIGWSANSQSLWVETDGDVPNAMAAPVITDVNEQSISMRIRLPQANGAAVTRVNIQTQCTGNVASVSTSSFRKLLRPASQDQRWDGMQCDVALLRNCDGEYMDGCKEHSVAGLLPGHVYYFRVKACNRYGWSPDGAVSDGICTNDTPKIVRRTARSVTLVWTKPYSTELIDKYQVQARVSYSTKWESMATSVVDQCFEVQDLIPAVAYSFRVVPHYAFRGWEEAMKCAHTELHSTEATVPEPPDEFRVTDRTAHSITLTWAMPRCNGHAVLGYQVEYQCLPSGKNAVTSDWETADSEISVGFEAFVIRHLDRGCAYRVRVRARSVLGYGDYALLPNPVSTYEILPPTAPECIAKTSFSLEIAWRDGIPSQESIRGSIDRSGAPAASGGGGGGVRVKRTPRLELEYEVHMSRVDSSTLHTSNPAECVATSTLWTTVARGLLDRHALISGLAPLGCYCFRVQAQKRADAPSSPSSRRASTVSCVAVTETTSGVQDEPGGATKVVSPVSSVMQTLRRL